jgi:hypothetical protein
MIATLDDLARAMKGMPRDARMFIRMGNGSLRVIEVVQPVLLGQDGREERHGKGYGTTLVVSP